MNRGSVSLIRLCIGTLIAFNEAPIHESGKCSRRGNSVVGSAPPFNEAPIHESGKCVILSWPLPGISRLQ